MKGYQAERSLCKKLEKLGFYADRIPSSGPGESPFPDIIATNKKKKISLSLEVKAYYARSVTIKKKQLVKAAMYLIRHHYDYETRMVGACVKFLMGERKKSPWVCRLIPVTDDMNLDELEDITVNIEDESDLPELTRMTLSRRARRIRRKRRERKA
jgi:Holliday junction resolvase